MGWNYRKSADQIGGIRKSFVNNGIDVRRTAKEGSAESAKECISSEMLISEAEVYYSKSLFDERKQSNGLKKLKINCSEIRLADKYPYHSAIANDNTGEHRELRARTQFELNLLEQVEIERQQINEIRMQRLHTASSKKEQAEIMNQMINQAKSNLQQLVTKTYTINGGIDWNKALMQKEFPVYQSTEHVTSLQGKYKQGFLKSLFMNEKKFEVSYINFPEYRAFEEKDKSILNAYMKQKFSFDQEKDKHDGELKYLKKRFEQSDKAAVEKYVAIILTDCDFSLDLDYDFDLEFKKDQKNIVVNVLFQDISSFPIVDKYLYNYDTSTIEEVLMPCNKAVIFYSEVLYSIGVRTIHEIFDSVYTDAIDSVSFIGYIEDTMKRWAFSIQTTRKTFESIDLSQPLMKILGALEIRTNSDFKK